MANCIRRAGHRWPHGVVPYRVHPDLDETEVQRAVRVWNQSGADIRFERYTGPTQVPAPPHVPPGPAPLLPSYVLTAAAQLRAIRAGQRGHHLPI